MQRQTWAVNDIPGVYNGARVTRPWLIGRDGIYGNFGGTRATVDQAPD